MNNDGILVSIITPIFNSERYLKECIESVVNQTNPMWELILVDDGSTDASPEICDQYALQDKRIRVIHKSNTGQFDSRMEGIKAATGNYCTGLDSDDYLESDFIEKLVSVLNKNKYDILCWKMKIVSNDNSYLSEGTLSEGEYDNSSFLKHVIKSSDHSFCNKLIRTDFLRKSYYGDVPIKARHSEDYILICPAICMADNVYVMGNALYNYRQLNDSVTHTYSLQRALDYLDSSNCIHQILVKYNMEIPELIKEENTSLVYPVGLSLKLAYKRGDISEEKISEILNHPVYKELSRYESLRYLTLDIWIFMKLFRHKCNSFLFLLFGKVSDE